MDDDHTKSPIGADYKCEAVLRAIADGHREIAAIAEVAELPRSTVVRVAALLRDHGRIRIGRGGSFELEILPGD